MKEKKYYGKEKCRILKQIRAEIAKQNDIAWVIEECSHKGDCRGTCPKCEAEVRQLERALERRAALGKTIAVVGISAGLSLSVAGCENPFAVQGKMQVDGMMEAPPVTNETETEQLEFDGVEIPDTDTVAVTEEALMGEPVISGEIGDETDPTCELPDDTEWGELGGAPLPDEYDYMDGVLIITVAETLPSCIAIEENCFYGYSKDGTFWRIYCDDTSDVKEGETYEIEIGKHTELTYPEEGLEGGWTPQYEATAMKINKG